MQIIEDNGKTIFKIDWDGRPFSVETGQLAKQANGSVLVRYGDSVVLVTATGTREPREGVDFFPLRVDWEERMYAAGRIPGSFFRREGRPTDRAVLSARLTDRPIRPLFPDGFRNEVQVIVTEMSYDSDHAPEVAGIFGASCALMISDIPFNGPLAGAIVGLVDGEFVLNPTEEQRARSQLDLVVAGTRDAILMIEAGANEVPEETILEAIFFGHRAIQPLLDLQEKMVEVLGKPKMDVPLYTLPAEIEQAVLDRYEKPLQDALRNADKQVREEAMAAVRQAALEELAETFPEQEAEINEAFNKLEKRLVRRMILDEGIRVDGRRTDELRDLHMEVGLLPRTHGSGLFQRGQTQVLTVASLGASSDRQMLDSLGHFEEFKRYIHHYNFPPFSVGEVRPLRGPGRREVGHGALAERALLPVLPSEEEFPYTIRLVSETLESNGSSSMASTCASSLALMDAGVPIKAAVAGISMGLVKEGDKIAILTDIQGIEDALGDMDFKVAGTRKGVTAIQLDSKISNLTRDDLQRALEQTRRVRLYILDRMAETIAEPRPHLSPYAPRIIIMQIDVDKIRDVIGPGGKVINKIIRECKVQIDIDEYGKIMIASHDEEGGRRAQEWIEQLTRDVEIGEVYVGTVTRMLKFGVFVELFEGKEGLVHISKLATSRVPTVEDVVKIGDRIVVMVDEIDEMGRINLSRVDGLRARPELQAHEVLSGENAEKFARIDDPVDLAARDHAPRGDRDRRGRRPRGGAPRPRERER